MKERILSEYLDSIPGIYEDARRVVERFADRDAESKEKLMDFISEHPYSTKSELLEFVCDNDERVPKKI